MRKKQFTMLSKDKDRLLEQWSENKIDRVKILVKLMDLEDKMYRCQEQLKSRL